MVLPCNSVILTHSIVVSISSGIVVHGRVGGLEPTRTIGDFDVKATQSPGVLSVIPHICVLEDINRPGLLFIGTDGIWDPLDGKAIVQLLKKNKKLW